MAVYELQFDTKICEKCETFDCLVQCQYMNFDKESAKKERQAILHGEDSPVLIDCLTCYACEEYCPYGNHPFYQIVDLQEKKGIMPAPAPITQQQIIMMQPRGKIKSTEVKQPVVDMCAFPMLSGCIRGSLFQGASTISGIDIFCNIMWLHFAKNSVIRKRVPEIIDTIQDNFLKQNHIKEIICFHDECYGTFTQLAPAFGIDVPFTPIHLFDYLNKRLDELKANIRPIGEKIAYQRPCSNRLIPESDHWLDDIFRKIGVERVEREYDRRNALCCGGVPRAQQRDELADDIQKRNLDDMQNSGAKYCVFNCPFCMFTLGEEAAERGLMPILVSDLCQIALGQ
jgi:Fe-S oxidoreductase